MLVNLTILKEQLGGVQTSLNFKTVEPFVKMVEHAFSKEVGAATLTAIENYPETEANEQLKASQELLKYFAQAYISWTAFDKAMPHIKLRIGDMGIMKSAPQNAIAVTKWEYLDTRESNLSMADESKEYFYQMLEELKPEVYTESDNFKARAGLLINSPMALAEHVPMVGRNYRLFNQIAVYIKRCQEVDIKELLTASVYDALIVKLKDGSQLDQNEEQLLQHIQKALGVQAMCEAIPYLQLKIDEDGFREIRKKDGLREEEIADVKKKGNLLSTLRVSADFYMSRLRKYMDTTATATLWAEYWEVNLKEADTWTEDYTNGSNVIF